MRTVTNERVEIYPCKCSDVSIEGTPKITFYFHLYLGTVSLPLLGFDYIDDCSFSHRSKGDIEVSAVSQNAGKRFYENGTLDIRAVMENFSKLRKR